MRTLRVELEIPSNSPLAFVTAGRVSMEVIVPDTQEEAAEAGREARDLLVAFTNGFSEEA